MIIVHTVPKEEWTQLAPHAHLAVFGEGIPNTQDRIDFALLAVDGKTDDVLGYITCKEFSPETLYMSYGGAFPPSAKKMLAWRTYLELISTAFKRGYKRIFYSVANDNFPMLKMAAKGGSRIMGVRCLEGAIMLDQQLEAAWFYEIYPS